MSFFKRLFSSGNNPNSKAFRIKRANELHGQVIKYVTERNENNDDVIGRGGALAVHGDRFIVDSSGDRLFVCEIEKLDVSYLMSGDGVVLRGPNILEDGRERCITVHFVYYRK
jgi:hypothetical protein